MGIPLERLQRCCDKQRRVTVLMQITPSHYNICMKFFKHVDVFNYIRDIKITIRSTNNIKYILLLLLQSCDNRQTSKK